MTISTAHLKKILSGVQQGRRLDPADIIHLLRLETEEDQALLFETARNIRKANFGNKIFTYGFAYTSTFCRNDCTFCYFRRSNEQPQRYRKKTHEVLDVARHLAKQGVNLIDLTMGEDPRLHQTQNKDLDGLIHLVKEIKTVTDLPIMVSPGVVPDQTLEMLAAAGVTWYACYQETHNQRLFGTLRMKQGFEERLQKKRLARKLGLLIEEGILCGVGESSSDIAHSIQVMHDLDADQVRVMKFVPQPGTPMAKHPEETALRECLVSAVLRLSFPDRLIPASLDVDGLSGLKLRLNAGANVITSLVPPDYGLSGVAHAELDIENANRTMTEVRPVLAECHLAAASNEDYLDWIQTRQKSFSSVRIY
jgi:methylornithine synthase